MSRRKPCPDPENYTWVHSKEGGYWRRKRGTIKPAKLNKVLKANRDAMKIASPASKKMVDLLNPFFEGMQVGRIKARLNGIFIRSIQEGEGIKFRYLKDFCFQIKPAFYEIMDGPIGVKAEGDKISVEIRTEDKPVKKLSQIVTDYYFEAILLSGEAGKKLKLEHIKSKFYPFGLVTEDVCFLELKLPKKADWMLLVKVGCTEGEEKAVSSRHYGMKVVETRNY